MANHLAVKHGFQSISADNIVQVYLFIFDSICNSNWLSRPFRTTQAEMLMSYASSDTKCRGVIQKAVPAIFNNLVNNHNLKGPAFLLRHTRAHPELRGQLPVTSAVDYVETLVAAEKFILASTILSREPIIDKAMRQQKHDTWQAIWDRAATRFSPPHP